MRDNGLTASSYVAIADIDPGMADDLLAILGDAEVAAYTEPCGPVVGACVEVRLPPVPCDRLYVDEDAEERARSLVGEHLPRLREAGTGAEADADAAAESETGTSAQDPTADRARMTTFDEERAWADIVAGYELTAPDAIPRWPVQEDVDTGSGDRGTRGNRGARGDRSERGDRSDGDDDPAGSADVVADDPDETDDREAESQTERTTAAEGRFVPPTPPPLPKVDMATKLALLALAGGPALLVLATVADFYVPTWFALVGVVAFIGGFLALVLRMKGGPPDDDDGAVV